MKSLKQRWQTTDKKHSWLFGSGLWAKKLRTNSLLRSVLFLHYLPFIKVKLRDQKWACYRFIATQGQVCLNEASDHNKHHTWLINDAMQKILYGSLFNFLAFLILAENVYFFGYHKQNVNYLFNILFKWWNWR